MPAIPELHVSFESRAAAGVSKRSNVESGGRTVATAAADFEAFVLQMFIEAMLPEDAANVFGDGPAGAFWKSMLAEQIATELARSGGVGIRQMIEPRIDALRGGESDDKGHR